MTNLQQSINEQVVVFVDNMRTLVRQATIEALEHALVVPTYPAKGNRRHHPPKKAGNGKSKRRAGQKPSVPRDPAELAEITERLYEAISSRPGEGMEVLAPAVGCPGRELRVSIDRLVSQGRVKKAGQRRSTRYFPMDAERG